MKHITRLSAVLVGLCFASTAFAGPQPKVDVCHVSGNSGNVQILSVNGNALSAHLAHGDNVPTAWYSDADGDGYGDASTAVTACSAPAGTVAVDGDCDDGDASSYPGAAELCDGLDNDCDGVTPTDELDLDADGWAGCDGDCDDTDANTFPGAAEACGDGVDNNCDAVVDENCGSTCEGANLVNHWSFDGDGLDLEGGNDFSVFGNASYVAGIDGQALRMNWQGAGASTPDLLSQFGNGPFTLAVWVNYHGQFAGHVRHEHIFFSTSAGRNRDLDLFAERGGGQTFYWTQGVGTQWYTFQTASWIAQQNQWHLVVLGRDANGVQYLCEDGVVTATDARFGNFQHSSAATFFLGRNPYENGGRTFPGTFDDMRVYDDWIGGAGCAEIFQTQTCD